MVENIILVVVGIAVYWFVFKIFTAGRESATERQKRLESERMVADRLQKLKSGNLRMLTVDELKFVSDNSRADEYVHFCARAILAGNKDAVRLMPDAERRAICWCWKHGDFSLAQFVKVCECVLDVCPDERWAEMLGDALREDGNALAARDAYIRGLNGACGYDENMARKTWPWLDKAWKGKTSNRYGRHFPPFDWKTAKLWHGSVREGCLFGYEVCRRRIQQEIDARNLKALESKGGYEFVKTGLDYERFVLGVIKNAGFECSVTPVTDQGVDIVVTIRKTRIAVQCKYYTETVSNAAVQEVVAGKAMYGCSHACVVSNSTYTPAAKALARANHVGLLHHAGIVEYLRKI